MRATVSALVLLLSGCLPPLSAVEGKACDDAHPCPDALFCVANVCSVDSTPPTTPMTRRVFGDDCESMANWTLSGGSRLFVPNTPAYAGSSSCRMQASDGPATAFGVESQALAVQTGLFCASAYLRQGTVPARATLVLRRFGGPAGTTLVEETPMTPASTLAADAGLGFQLVTTRLPVDLATTAGVKVAMSVEARVGASVLFDELVVTLTTHGDGGCP